MIKVPEKESKVGFRRHKLISMFYWRNSMRVRISIADSTRWNSRYRRSFGWIHPKNETNLFTLWFSSFTQEQRRFYHDKTVNIQPSKPPCFKRPKKVVNLYMIPYNVPLYKLSYFLCYLRFFDYFTFLGYFRYLSYLRFFDFFTFLGYSRCFSYLKNSGCLKFLEYLMYLGYLRYLGYLMYLGNLRFLGYFRYLTYLHWWFSLKQL